MLRGWESTLSWAVAVFFLSFYFCVLLPLSVWAQILLFFVCLLRELLRSCLWPWRVNKLISLGRRWLLFLPPISSHPLHCCFSRDSIGRCDETRRRNEKNIIIIIICVRLLESLHCAKEMWNELPSLKNENKLNELKRERGAEQTNTVRKICCVFRLNILIGRRLFLRK